MIKVDLLNRNDPRKWSLIMMRLKNESPHVLFNHEFYQWLEKEWGWKVITTEEDSEGYITAFEIDDASYALLLLKFPEEQWHSWQ